MKPLPSDARGDSGYSDDLIQSAWAERGRMIAALVAKVAKLERANAKLRAKCTRLLRAR